MNLAFRFLCTILPATLPAIDPEGAKELTTTADTPRAVATNLFDFGQATFGWLELLDVPPGDYRLALGEMTNSQGLVCNPFPHSTIRAYTLDFAPTGHLFRVPLPPAPLNLRGYFKDAPAIRIPPQFGIVAPYRFVQILRSPAPLSPANLRRQSVHYPIDLSQSFFHSDNPLLDRLYTLCKHTIHATSFCGIYIDGDRERTPYEGDAYINQLAHYAIDPDPTLARRTLHWLAAHPTWPTEWKQHLILIAWADWLQTGDPRALIRHYETFQRSLLGTTPRRDLVDWPPGERDGFVMVPEDNSVVAAFYVRTLQIMAEIARLVGKPRDAESYRAAARKAHADYLRDYYLPDRKLFRDATTTLHTSLHANALPLALDLAPPEAVSTIARHLEGKGMACSVYFAHYLLEALAKAGRSDLALSLMLAENDRSWRTMLDFGATMTMEAWSPSAKPNLDLNHAWATAPLHFIARRLLGVCAAVPGWRSIELRPCLDTFRFLDAQVPTPRGPVRLTLRNQRLSLSLPVPATLHWRGKVYALGAGEHAFD